MKVCMVGEGAMGNAHMSTLSQMQEIEVVTVAGGLPNDTTAFAEKWKIPHHSLSLEECLSRDGVEAAILTSPNQIHADQAALCVEMGKHVLIEIPMGLNLEESSRVAALEDSGLVVMVCHSLRYAPAHRELRRRVAEGELHPHHLVAHTYFLRRENVNMFGNPRTWTDDLLWHQACHTIDYIYWLFGNEGMQTWAQAGPLHDKLQIPMDMTIGMRSNTGALATVAMSFNNHGTISVDFRLIGEENTYLIAGGKLTDWEGNEIESKDPGPGQDQDFFNAIKTGTKPLTSVGACLPVMGLLDSLQQSIDAG